MIVQIVPAEDAFDDLIAFALGMENAPPDVEAQGVSIVSEIVQDAVRANFAQEGSGAGAWQPLAPATVSERIRLGYGGEHPILVRTGDYKASFTGGDGFVEESAHSSGTWMIRIGSDDIRATTHEFGRGGIPARPVLSFDDSILDRLDDGVVRILGLLERTTRG